jgi:hypothetical protein
MKLRKEFRNVPEFSREHDIFSFYVTGFQFMSP